MQQGDPRGELIAVQLARDDRPADAWLAKRETELLAEHEDIWLGGLTKSIWPGPPIAVEWDRGFVRTVYVDGGYETEDAAFTYRAFVELPSAALVRDVNLCVGCSYNGRGEPDTSILHALRDHPMRTARELSLIAFDHQLSWTHVGDLSIAKLDYVEDLRIEAGQLTLGAIDMPRLKKLRIETGGLRAHVLRDLAAARWPALEHLTLYFGTANYGGDCTLADVAPILDGANLPHVTSLGLCNGEFADELAAALPGARILPRLQHLDLSAGTMGSDGARAILDHANAFEHLASITLGDNFIAPDLATELLRRLPQIAIGTQKIEGEYGRFVSVAE